MSFFTFKLGDVLEYTITGLHPGRKYDVRVVPGSMNVSGQWYSVEMPRVMADATTSPPSSNLAAPAVELTSSNSTSVFVTWQDMGPSSGRQAAHFMQLNYRIQGGRDTSPVVLLPASGSQWINGLKTGTIYEFQVTSGHEGRPDGPSTTTSIRTLWDSGTDHEEEDTDSESRVIRVNAQVLSSSAIQVSWHPLPPETLSNVLYYTIRYVAVPESNTPAKFQFIRSTGRQVKLTNLTAYTLYRVDIRSHDRQGRSSTFSSPPTEAKTMADLPGPPLDLSFTVSPDGTGQVTWKPPSPTNGIILTYAILLSDDPQAPLESWTRREEDPGVWLRTQLRGFTPGTMYYVRMQAQTSIGWGPLTAPLISSFPPPATLSDSSHVRLQEQYLGAFIGVGISLVLAVTCSISIFLRTRCIKRMSSERSGSPPGVPAADVSRPAASGTSSAAVAMNGLAVCNGKQHTRHKQSLESLRRNGPFGSREREDVSLVEMEAFVPMLATIPVEESCHLDTKGGYQTGSRGSHREDSLCNGSLRGVGGGGGGRNSRLRDENNDEDENENEGADRSELPLLSLQSSSGAPLDGTILSQATETTCLSLDYSGRNRRRRRHQQRQGSLHSHDSSLHSLDSRTNSSSDSSRSLRGQDDNDTGICHADHQMNDSGLVVAVVTGSTSNNNRTTPKGSGELVMT